MQIALGRQGGEHIKYQNKEKVHWLEIQVNVKVVILEEFNKKLFFSSSITA